MRWRVAQVQMRPKKADVAANLERVVEALCQAVDVGADMVCFPEACLSGYFLMGGVDEVSVEVQSVVSFLEKRFSEERPGASVEVVLGFYERSSNAVYNSAAHIRIGAKECGAPHGLLHVHRKVFLPTYGVFDERRYVARGHSVEAYSSAFGCAAILICEDAWHSICPAIAALRGAEVIIIPSASPCRGLRNGLPDNTLRWKAVSSLMASEHGCYVIRTDLVGFEGGKGFAGVSTVHDPFGECIAEGPLLQEALVIADLDSDTIQLARTRTPLTADLAESVGSLAAQLRPQQTGGWA